MFRDIIKGKAHQTYADSDEESESTIGSIGTVFTYRDAIMTGVDGNSSTENSTTSTQVKNLPKQLSKLGQRSYSDIPSSIFKIKSDLQNMGLNMRCGHAERKNDCNYMEDFVSVHPTFNNADTKKEKDDELIDEDFSFCGVYDGHGGTYVSKYLQDHLYSTFCSTLHSHSNEENGDNASGSCSMSKLDQVRISFKEACCKIDREILLKDYEEMTRMSVLRTDALSHHHHQQQHHHESDRDVEDEGVVVADEDNSRPLSQGSGALSNQSFAGSCAVVAILYHSKTSAISLPVSLNASSQKLTPQRSMTSLSHSLTCSALKLHSVESPAMSALLRQNLITRAKSMRMFSTMSSDGDDYSALLPSFDIDSDSPLITRGGSNPNMEIIRAMKSRSSVQSILSDLSDRSFNRQESFSFYRQESFPRQFGGDHFNFNCDDSGGYISVKLTPKQAMLLKALREDGSVALSNFDYEEVQELANDLKARSTEFQKYADDYNNHAEELFRLLNDTSSTESPTMDIDNNAALAKLLSEDSDDISSLGNASKSSSSRPTLTPKSSMSGGSSNASSFTSLKSFGETDLSKRGGGGGGGGTKGFPALSTVSEGVNESRQTSFATTRLPSQESQSTRNEATSSTPPVKHVWTQPSGEHNIELSETKNCILIGHVGDCRAVLCDKGVAIMLTEDHTPIHQDEVTRIKASGGFVSKKRVNGLLAVSRSFGDIKYKKFDSSAPPPESFLDEELLPNGIWSHANTVISMPDILELQIQPTYEFIILASDGLWSVFSCAEAVQYVRAHLFAHENATEAANALMEQASKEGATDNASVVIICLNQI